MMSVCRKQKEKKMNLESGEAVRMIFHTLIAIFVISCPEISLGIEIALSNSEIDTVFWNAAAPGTPTEGLKDFLGYLKNKGIRSGVISNISYAPSVVAERINRLLPENAFEFIITSSNYIFRKPNPNIFDLALEKAGLRSDEVWYIGDQYECDIKGSLNAGLFPVWYIGAIDLPYTEDKNILTAKTWDEIERYMEVSCIQRTE